MNARTEINESNVDFYFGEAEKRAKAEKVKRLNDLMEWAKKKAKTWGYEIEIIIKENNL